MLYDSHCHLDHYHDDNLLDNVIDNCIKHNVKKLLAISTMFSRTQNILDIVNKYNSDKISLRMTIGNHPIKVDKEEMKSVDQIIQLFEISDQISGIGETGFGCTFTTCFGYMEFANTKL